MSSGTSAVESVRRGSAAVRNWRPLPPSASADRNAGWVTCQTERSDDSLREISRVGAVALQGAAFHSEDVSFTRRGPPQFAELLVVAHRRLDPVVEVASERSVRQNLSIRTRGHSDPRRVPVCPVHPRLRTQRQFLTVGHLRDERGEIRLVGAPRTLDEVDEIEVSVVHCAPLATDVIACAAAESACDKNCIGGVRQVRRAQFSQPTPSPSRSSLEL